jgi:hypothetical protein
MRPPAAGSGCAANSVTQNKIPLASETNQGFMFGNKQPNWTPGALVIWQ